MNKLHQKLHLQHHHHTGKLLHHHHTSYRGLAILIGMAGVFIIGLSAMARVTADTLYVYARNPAPIPTSSAVITSPLPGAVINETELIVRGICPAMHPRVIMVIFDNGLDAGSAACDDTNHFAVSITMIVGHHNLVATSYTITTDPGPESNPVNITAVPPPVPIIGERPQLKLTIDVPFIIFGPGKDAQWVGSITGGSLPYKVYVDWGDGSTDHYTAVKSGQHYFYHHYTIMRPHDIAFTVSDSSGQNAIKHSAAVTPYVPPVAAGTQIPTSSPLSGGGLIGVYGAYIVVLAVFGMVWVGAHPFAYATVPAAHGRLSPRGVKSHRTKAR